MPLNDIETAIADATEAALPDVAKNIRELKATGKFKKSHVRRVIKRATRGRSIQIDMLILLDRIWDEPVAEGKKNDDSQSNS